MAGLPLVRTTDADRLIRMPTLADVARQAQVSKTTASRVLNGLAGRYRITPATVALVEAAARTLGYRPSYAARALTRGRTDSIGVMIHPAGLVNTATQPFMATLLGGIQRIAQAAGRHVVLTDHGERFRATADEPDGRFDGLIALGYVLQPDVVGVDMETMPTPLVLIGEPAQPTRRPVVVLDPEPGLGAAVAHLAGLGHRSIAWVSLARPVEEQSGRITPEDPQWRARCVTQQAAALGLTCAVISAGVTGTLRRMPRDQIISELTAALAPALVGITSVTAVCCYNDLVAAAVMRAARSIGRRIPEDLSVIGFDDLGADVAEPPLTTVDHRLDLMGARATEILLELIDEPAAASRWSGRQERIPAALVVRHSTAVVPESAHDA